MLQTPIPHLTIPDSRCYNRAYFNYALDSASQTLLFLKPYDDSLSLFRFRISMPDSNTIRLCGKQKQDSLYVELKKKQRHFQLAEKQFHWLTEYNRQTIIMKRAAVPLWGSGCVIHLYGKTLLSPPARQ